MAPRLPSRADAICEAAFGIVSGVVVTGTGAQAGEGAAAGLTAAGVLG